MDEKKSISQLNTTDNLEKYKSAGIIVTNAMNKIIEFVKEGTRVLTICKIGDTFINNALNSVFKKIKHKGIAFPTCININNCAGYYSPLDDSVIIKNGDIVNIELGAHIDGFPAFLGYTVVVNDEEEKVTGKRAKLMHAVSEASKNVLSLFKVGKTNTEVVKELDRCAKKYDCNLIYVDNPNLHAPGVMSFQVSKNVIDGKTDDDDDPHQMILARNSKHYDFTMTELEFDKNEVYSVDVMMTTGTGKLNPTMDRVTVFKRNDNFYNLKRKSSKLMLSKFKNKVFPTNIRNFKDINDSTMRAGIIECIQHNLLEPYGIYAEKNGEYVAQIKFTVIVKKKKPILIAGMTSDLQLQKVVV